MSDLLTNLNSIYTTKLQIKEAIGTSSDVFSDYPGYISSMVLPDGTAYITANGVSDISSYQYVDVNVPSSGQTIAQKNAAWQTKWAPALSTMAAGLYAQDPSYGEPQITSPSGWCVQTALDGNAAMSELIALDCLWIEIFGYGSNLHEQYVQIFTQMGLTLDSDGHLVSTDDDKILPFDADEAIVTNITGVLGLGCLGGKKISSLNGGIENAKWNYYGTVFNGTGFDYAYIGQFDYVVNQFAMLSQMHDDGVTFINDIPAVDQNTLHNYLIDFQLDGTVIPSGTIYVTNNGTYDIASDAYVNVAVQGGGSEGHGGTSATDAFTVDEANAYIMNFDDSSVHQYGPEDNYPYLEGTIAYIYPNRAFSSASKSARFILTRDGSEADMTNWSNCVVCWNINSRTVNGYTMANPEHYYTDTWNEDLDCQVHVGDRVLLRAEKLQKYNNNQPEFMSGWLVQHTTQAEGQLPINNNGTYNTTSYVSTYVSVSGGGGSSVEYYTGEIYEDGGKDIYELTPATLPYTNVCAHNIDPNNGINIVRGSDRLWFTADGGTTYYCVGGELSANEGHNGEMVQSVSGILMKLDPYPNNDNSVRLFNNSQYTLSNITTTISAIPNNANIYNVAVSFSYA